MKALESSVMKYHLFRNGNKYSVCGVCREVGGVTCQEMVQILLMMINLLIEDGFALNCVQWPDK